MECCAVGPSRVPPAKEVLGALARSVCEKQAVHALAVNRCTSATISMQADIAVSPAVGAAPFQHSLQTCTVERGFAQVILDTDFWCSSAMLLTRARSIPCDATGSTSQSGQPSQWTPLRQGVNWSSGTRSMNKVVPSRAFVTGVGHTTRRQKSAHYLQALRLARCCCAPIAVLVSDAAPARAIRNCGPRTLFVASMYLDGLCMLPFTLLASSAVP